MRVFQNFRGRRKVFLGFFEGLLLALESLCLAVAASSFFPRFSFFFNVFDQVFFRILLFGSFFYFKAYNFCPHRLAPPPRTPEKKSIDPPPPPHSPFPGRATPAPPGQARVLAAPGSEITPWNSHARSADFWKSGYIPDHSPQALNIVLPTLT